MSESFANLYVEQALRGIIESPSAQAAPSPPSEAGEGLADDDPFFTGLEEVRALGRLPAPHRQVELR